MCAGVRRCPPGQLSLVKSPAPVLVTPPGGALMWPLPQHNTNHDTLIVMGQPAQPHRAAIYLRISRDKEGGGLGVARQRSDCLQLAERNGWPAFEEYTDNDLSAYSGKVRPHYQRLLADIKAGKITVVLAWHTDRLHRSPIELENWIDIAGSRNVDVHTVKAGPIDLATPSGRMVARQLGAVARYESEHRSERVRAKFDQIARDGGFMGGSRPFGYSPGGLTLRPSEADLIREGTRMILAGNSLRTVTRMFRESGTVTAKLGREWTPRAVKGVLTRARNAALLEHRGHVVGPASWPPIVTEDEWRGICAVLNDPSRNTSPGNQPRWLGSLIYRCVCGDTLRVGTSGGGKRAPSYRCLSAGDGGVHVSRHAPAVDEFIGRVIVGILSRDDNAQLFRVKVPEVDTEGIRSQIVAIEVQRKELGARLGRGEVTIDMLDAANAGLRERQQALEAELASAARTSPAAELASKPDVEAAWKELALDVKRTILKELATVTLVPARRGQLPNGQSFDTDSVKIEPKELGN